MIEHDGLDHRFGYGDTNPRPKIKSANFDEYASDYKAILKNQMAFFDGETDYFDCDQ